MCGIIGYIDNQDINSILLDGLRRLEYRGYDSAGVATLADNKIVIKKERGKIAVLGNKIKRSPLEGNLGIGHSRWATHGEPSEENAHPHTNCSGNIALVHNGIIENFQSLKKNLIREGHNFKSDTNTEVIVHLIEKYLAQNGKNLSLAVGSALQDVKGTYAIALRSKDSPDRFIAAKNGSPLIVGLGKAENFIASDVPAMFKHTRDVVILDDYQMVEVSKDEIKITNLEGKNLPYKSTRID